MATDSDLLAAELAGIRERADVMRNRDVWVRVAAAERDRDRLLGAVEAVLKQAADWEAERGDPLSEHAERTSLLFAARYARVDAGVALREAIGAELLGKETDHA
jgi:hypothetical protein